MPLISYTESSLVFALGNSKAPQATEAAVMDAIVIEVSRALDRWLNQIFAYQAYVDQTVRAQIDQDGILQCWPAVPTMSAPTAIAYRIGSEVDWNDISSATVDIIENTSGCQLRILRPNLGYLRFGRQVRMKLSYTGGWASLADVPPEFEYGARRLCWMEYKKRDQGEQGKTAIPQMGIITTPQSWPADMKRAFSNYRRLNT